MKLWEQLSCWWTSKSLLMHLWIFFSFHVCDCSQKILEVTVGGALKQNLIHLFIQKHFLSAHCVSGAVPGSRAMSVKISYQDPPQDPCSRTPKKCEAEQEQPAFRGLGVILALQWAQELPFRADTGRGGSPGESKLQQRKGVLSAHDEKLMQVVGLPGRWGWTPRSHLSLLTDPQLCKPNKTERSTEQEKAGAPWGGQDLEWWWLREARPFTREAGGVGMSAPSGARQAECCLPGPEPAAGRTRSRVTLRKALWKQWTMP